MQSRQDVHQKLNEYFISILPEKLSNPLLKKINCLNKGDFNKRFEIRFASDESHLGHWWRNPIYLLAKPSANKVTLNFTLQPQRWPKDPIFFAKENIENVNSSVKEINSLIKKHQLQSSEVECEVKTEGKYLLSIAFAITMGSPNLEESNYVTCIDFISELALINHHLSESLNSGISVNDTQEEDNSDDDSESELGFPAISLTLGKHVDEETMRHYFSKWQKPSTVYNGRLGIKGFIPGFINTLNNDQVCPVFTVSDFNTISRQISENKIIPVLDYLPREFGIDKPWWIVPYCIWNEANASVLVLNKDGLYALDDNAEALKIIFGMDKIDKVEFEHVYDGDRFINRLYVHTENGYMAIDEFVLSEDHINSESYLSILGNIISIRQATINASKGQPMWFEGAGGEGFASINSPLDMLSPQAWENPLRPDPKDFGFNNEAHQSNAADKINETKTIILNDILASLAFLYLCVAGVDSGINEAEMNTVKAKLSEWKEDGDVTDCLNFVVSFWKTLDGELEKMIVEEIAQMLKSNLDENNLKAIKSDLLKIINTDDVIQDSEKGIILFICSILD